MPADPATLARLQHSLQKLCGEHHPMGVLGFGIDAIDARLPGGGLALGAVHEVTDGSHGASAGLFAAGIAARTRGQVLWCVARPDLFAPALAQAGLAADRVIHVEAGDDKTVLACAEEGLRHGGLGAVVAESGKLSLIASRRLQLAAEGSPTLGVILRRWRRDKDAAEFALPTAAMTRWRVTPAPSCPLPVPGLGRALWKLELVRARGGQAVEFIVEACDEQGRLALPAAVAHRPGQEEVWIRRAAS